MICYIKDSKYSEKEKKEYQAQHEFYLEKLLKDEDFKGKKLDDIIPTKNGIMKLYDQNNTIGNVYGLHDSKVTANIFNLKPIVGTAKIYSYLDEIENPEYKDLVEKLQQYRFDFDIVETNENVINIENDIFINPNIEDFDKKLLQAILVRIEPSLLSGGSIAINRVKSALKSVGLIDGKVIDSLFANNDLNKNIQKVNDDLEIQIGHFLSHFGVKIQEYESLKEALGVDTMGFTDVLNKTIWVAKNRNVDVLSEEAAHIILMLMGDNNNTLNTILGNVHRWYKYKSISKKYFPLYKNTKQVKIHAVALLLKESFVKKARPHKIKELSLVQKLKSDIKDFFQPLIDFVYTNNRLPFGEVLDLVDIIANNVLNGDTDFINSVVPKFEKLNSDIALSKNPFAKKIIDTITTHNGTLTGSLAIAMQDETIFRSSDDPIHDLDFRIMDKDYQIVKSIVQQDLKGIDLHDAWSGDNGKVTYSYAVPLEGFSVVLRPEHLRKGKLVNYYDVIDADGNIVEKSHKNNLLLDFFVYPDSANFDKKILLPYDDIYLGKLSLSYLKDKERLFDREKDLDDYIHFKPNVQLAPKQQFLFYTPKNNVLKFGIKENIELDYSDSAIEEEITIQESQITDTVPQSNEELSQTLVNRLKQHFPDFKLEYLKLDVEGHNGVVNFANKLIQVQIGNNPAITEEMAHVFLEHHKDRDKLIRLVVGTKIFNDTFDEYKEVYGWDIEKIKREAAAKLLAQTMYAQNTGDYTTFNEWTTKNVDARKKLLAQIKEYIKDLFIYLLQTDMSLYHETAKDILNNNFVRQEFAHNKLQELGSMYQLSTEKLRSRELNESVISVLEPLLKEEGENPIVTQLNSAKNIIDLNFKLFVQDEFKGKIILPRDNVDRAIKITDNLAKSITNKHDNLSSIASSYIALFDGVGKMGNVLTKAIEDKSLSPFQLVSIKYVIKQWQHYLNTFEESTDYKLGGIEELVLDTRNSLSRAEEVLYNRFKNVSAQVLYDIIKPIFDNIIADDKKELKKINALFDNEVVNDLAKAAKKQEKLLGELTLDDLSFSNNKEKLAALFNLGLFTHRAANKFITNIVNKTLSVKDVTNIILSRDTNYGDVSMVGNIFLTASSRDDLIIPAIQKIIDNAKIEGQLRSMEINGLLENSIKPFLKNMKISPSEIGKLITTGIKRKVNGKYEDTLALITDFKHDIHTELDQLRESRDKEIKKSKEWKEKNKNYRDFKIKNFYSELTEEGQELLNISFVKEIDGEMIDVGHEYKTRIDEIYTQINKIAEDIEQIPVSIENEDYIDKLELQINVLHNEANALAQLKEKGIEKTGIDLAIAEYVREKRAAYREVYTNTPNVYKLLSTWNKYYNNIVKPSGKDSDVYKDFDNSLRTIIHSTDSDNFKLVKIYEEYKLLVETASQNDLEHKLLKKWFMKNIKVNSTAKFYDNRKNTIAKIDELNKETKIIVLVDSGLSEEDATAKVEKEMQDEKNQSSFLWNEIIDKETKHRDEARVVVGKSMSNETQQEIKELQMRIELNKQVQEDDKKSSNAIYLKKKKEIKALFSSLRDMQESNVTDYYIEELSSFSDNTQNILAFYEFLSLHVATFKINAEEFDNPELLQEENDKTEQNLINYAIKFLDITDPNLKDEFTEWFKRNHHLKSKQIIVNKDKKTIPYFEPIHIWKFTAPKSISDFDIKLNNRHSTRSINEKYQMTDTINVNGKQYNTKDDFERWKPKLFTKDGKDLHINRQYDEIEKDPNLFGILKNLTKIHVKNQIQNDSLVKNKLLYIVPQFHKEKFEDVKEMGFKRIKDGFFSRNQQEGNENFSIDEPDLSIGERAVKLTGKITGYLFNSSKSNSRVDYQGDKIITVALSHYNHVNKSLLSNDIIRSVMASTESYAIHKSFNGIHPQLDILYNTIKKFNKSPNREKALGNMLDGEISGINQLFEVGKQTHGTVSKLKLIAAIRSQSILNIKGAVKNLLAGIGNTWIHKDMLSDYALHKAVVDWQKQYINVKHGLLGDKKTDDFKIFEFFLPATNGKWKYYLSNKIEQTFQNTSAGFSFQEEGEINIAGIMLQMFLNKPYRNGKLKDFIQVSKNADGIAIVSLKEGTAKELNDFKIMFTEVLRVVQGNQGGQKGLTEMDRSTVGGAIMMFRKYLPNTLLNYFEAGIVKRTSLHLQKDMQGFYIEGAVVFLDFVNHVATNGGSIEGFRKFWAETTQSQKDALLKIFKQLCIIYATKLILAFAFDDDDEDRYDKLRDRPYALNMLLYQLMAVKQELTGWSPISPLDLFNEGVSAITKTSIAFEELKKIAKLFADLWNLVTFDEDAYIKRTSPFAQKGDVKLFADLQKIFGMYNLYGTFDNEKFVSQIKDFANMLEK